MNIELYSSQGKLLEYLYQWDRDIELTIKNNSGYNISEIHFSNLLSNQALVLEPYDRGTKVKVPNILLTKIHAITIHFCTFTEEDGFKTFFEYIVPIRSRQKPEEYVYTETEVLSYKNLEKRVSDIENSISEEAISAVVSDYLAENPVQGTQGADGKDGVSVTHQWDGTVLTVTSASGTSSADLKGVKGDKGDTGAQGVQGVQGEKGDKGDTGEKGADGKDGADGYTPVKGTDYFTDTDKAEMVEEVTSAIKGIPDYWKTALEEGAKAINTALCTAGANKSAFLFYSDAHWDSGSKMSPKLLKYLYEHTGMTKTAFGGDIVNSEAEDYDTMSYLWEWRSQLKGLPNHHSVVGNHDDGNDTNNLFDEKYVYGYLLAAEETPDMIRGNGMYYYIDHSPEKTRYLYLDTAYIGVNSEQQEFIENALLSTPDGWHIVVISHIWYYPDYDQYDVTPIPIGGVDSNALKVMTMLDSYNSRTGIYAQCGGWVEFCIGGHVHRDYDGTTETGIPIILVETDSEHIRSELTYTEGTTDEASVNGIIADYDNHKIYIIRIGRGESREVEITNYVLSYTNLIPTAESISDNTIIGYMENTRYSSSSNGFVEQTGWDSIGLIACSPGDVIRFANMTIQPHTEDLNSNRGAIQFWTESKEWIASYSLKCSDISQWGSFFNPEFDSNGNIIKITVPSNGEYANACYFQITCQDVNVSSVITINEPIE